MLHHQREAGPMGRAGNLASITQRCPSVPGPAQHRSRERRAPPRKISVEGSLGVQVRNRKSWKMFSVMRTLTSAGEGRVAASQMASWGWETLHGGCRRCDLWAYDCEGLKAWCLEPYGACTSSRCPLGAFRVSVAQTRHPRNGAPLSG